VAECRLIAVAKWLCKLPGWLIVALILHGVDLEQMNLVS